MLGKVCYLQIDVLCNRTITIKQKEKEFGQEMSFSFIDVSQNSCNLDHPRITVKSVLSWCKLGKVLSMALAHSFYVKTEAQRRVKFSAVLKPVSAKKKKVLSL